LAIALSLRIVFTIINIMEGCSPKNLGTYTQCTGWDLRRCPAPLLEGVGCRV
jgi:hypothetical protein